MILVSQIKAARGLLDWSQADLAKASGLSLPAITKIEGNSGHPRHDSVVAIKTAFEKHGVEFLDTPGVQLRFDPFNIDVWRGPEAILTLWKDIEQNFLAGSNNELLLSGVSEKWWLKNYAEPLRAFQRKLAALNVHSRLLICEGDTLITAAPECYRAVPKWLFAQTPHYVYADKMALINIGPPLRIVSIQSAATADTFRQQFELNWQQGKKLKIGS